MDEIQAKTLKIQSAFKALSLDAENREISKVTDKVLVGKFLATRRFNRSIIADIVAGAWSTKRRVKIQQLGEDTFKFTFELKEDKLSVYERRPWNFNGAVLVLKEWTTDIAIHEINFSTTAFFIQVHGLPPKILHPDNALKIGSQLGVVYKESITMKSVVGGRFLRLRVEIPLDTPLTTGFFYQKDKGEEIWVHFKYEKLADFCYSCGMLNHVTGRCPYKSPAKITSGKGISAKLYGPWLRASSKDFLQFLNSPEKADRRKDKNFWRSIQNSKIPEIKEKAVCESYELALMNEISQGQKDLLVVPVVESDDVIIQTGETREEIQAVLSGELANSETHWSRLERKLRKDDRLDLLFNLAEMNPAIAALKMSLQGNFVNYAPDMLAAYLNYAEEVNYDARKVEIWAAAALKNLPNIKAHNSAQLLLTTSGEISPATGQKIGMVAHEPVTQRKRMGHFMPSTPGKKLCKGDQSLQDGQSQEGTPCSVSNKSKNLSSPIVSSLGGSSSGNSNTKWAWKKEARRKAAQSVLDGENSTPFSAERDISRREGIICDATCKTVVGVAEPPHHEK